jgi:uncharacterized protein (TIGR02145 family)
MKKCNVVAFILLPICFCIGDPGNVLEDIDGNVYRTVKLGNQIWTVGNFRSTKYNDGTPILHIKDGPAWTSRPAEKGAYCYYDNFTHSDSINKHGALYNWYVVNTKKLAPKGWRVPTNADWDTLTDYLIKNGYNWNGETEGNRTAKSLAAKSGWRRTNWTGAVGFNMETNNKSGFAAYPSGHRGHTGGFAGLGRDCHWWTSSKIQDSGCCVYSRSLYYGNSGLDKPLLGSNKDCGYSIRLVRN